jgi:hypothetical protein
MTLFATIFRLKGIIKLSTLLYGLYGLPALADAQDSLKIKPFIYHQTSTVEKKHYYQPFVYQKLKTISYYNYPLTSNEIIARERGKVLYNRVYNTFTNHNRDGIFSNLTGLSKVKASRADPRF